MEASQAQNETTTQTETVEKPIYPGRLAEYHRLKTEREACTVTDDASASIKVGLQIAEQLAGLSYILDGIRFSARNQS